MKISKASEHVSRRERERLAHQNEILLAARELFARDGFHDTTLDGIAQHAEFAKGTIYNYFSSKDDLFFTIIEQVLEGIQAIAESAVRMAHGDSREALTTYARDLARYCQEHSDLVRVIGRDKPRIDSQEYGGRVEAIKRRHSRIAKILARPLLSDMRAGKLRSLDADEVAFLFNGMLTFYFIHRMNEQESCGCGDIDQMVSLVVTLFFEGLERK
jgi:AcrR family transcriptional regulator